MSNQKFDEAFEIRRLNAAKSMSVILRKLNDLDPVLCYDLELWLDRNVDGLRVVKHPSDCDCSLVITRRQWDDLITKTLKGALNHG